tara:strand:- start:7732 stop:7881 length:150 start_codon:yes stop_codon:yes gene_type:complete
MRCAICDKMLADKPKKKHSDLCSECIEAVRLAKDSYSIEQLKLLGDKDE